MQWVSVSLSERVTGTLLNFRKHGGHLRKEGAWSPGQILRSQVKGRR